MYDFLESMLLKLSQEGVVNLYKLKDFISEITLSCLYYHGLN